MLICLALYSIIWSIKNISVLNPYTIIGSIKNISVLKLVCGGVINSFTTIEGDAFDTSTEIGLQFGKLKISLERFTFVLEKQLYYIF